MTASEFLADKMAVRIMVVPSFLLLAALASMLASCQDSETEYFTISPEGKWVRMIGFPSPTHSDIQVADWVASSVARLYTYSYRDFEERIVSHWGPELMTLESLGSFLAEKSDFIQSLQKTRSWGVFVPIGDALILDKERQGDKLAWTFELRGYWELQNARSLPKLHEVILHVHVRQDYGGGDGLGLKIYRLDMMNR